MSTFEYQERHFYIDARLKDEMDDKVIPDLKTKDKDFVLCVDGEERSGKSVFAQGLASYVAYRLGSKFDISNICMTPEEFKTKIENAQKNECIIYDEAHRGMGSRRSLSEINQLLVDLMMEMGQKNLFVVIVLPTFFMLDKYPALHRARGLVHIYENKGKRGFWVWFNRGFKLKLYMKGKKEFNHNCIKWPSFRGRFSNQYGVDEEAYRVKKGDSFKNKARIMKAEIYIQQRDLFMYILHKELDIGTRELAKLYKSYNTSGFKPLGREAIRERIHLVEERQEL